MIYLGIDPGQKGGIAWLGKKYHTYAMPDTTKAVLGLIQALSTGLVTTCIIEHAQAMPKQGGVSMFNYGQHYGELIGIMTALGIKIIEVRAAVWKKAMGLTKDKDASIALCERLFPSVDLLPSDRSRKPSDGMAEALLLAEYGRRMNL